MACFFPWAESLGRGSEVKGGDSGILLRNTYASGARCLAEWGPDIASAL